MNKKKIRIFSSNNYYYHTPYTPRHLLKINDDKFDLKFMKMRYL